MNALCWYGKRDVRVENVPEPQISNPRDIIVRVTLTGICGSDVQLYNGLVPGMKRGDILGHEIVGEVIEVGSDDGKDALRRGDRVVVAYAIACGQCFFCQNGWTSACDNSNPNTSLEDRQGYTPAGIFGYGHLYGGYAGGQAEYVRVPFGDAGALKIPDGISDEQALFLSDIFPAGYMAAENCDIKPGEAVAIWGCGPVGQFAIRSAWLFGAGKVIAIDSVSERLELARAAHAETINCESVDDVVEELKEMTGGVGPDCCIDTTGMEAQPHSVTVRSKLGIAKTEGCAHKALTEAIQACRKCGTISMPGIYGNFSDSASLSVAFGKGLTLKMGQTHVHGYMTLLLSEIEAGSIDPSSIITHRAELNDGPKFYEKLANQADRCIKVVMRP